MTIEGAGRRGRFAGAGPALAVALCVWIRHHEQVRRVFTDDVGLNGSDLQLPIPLDVLSAGAYLFTVEARLGSTLVTREVRFTVRR